MAKKKQVCVVTGGAGFIGSHIATALVQKGYKVRVFDNLFAGDLEHLKHIRKKITFQKGDVRRLPDLRKAFKGADYVFHLAAIRAVLRSVDKPTETHDVNATGTLNVLLAAKDAGIKRVINTSTSAVYGDIKNFPTREDDEKIPESPYGAAKLSGEYYCKLFASEYKLSTVSLRYFNVFGPRQNPESQYSAVIPIFIQKLLCGERPEIHWDGKQSRDFVHVDNVVHANLLAMKKREANGEVFNVGTGEELSVLDILHATEKILKVHDIKPKFAKRRKGDVRRTLANIQKIKRKLGYKVQRRFKSGIEDTVRWFLENEEVLKKLS